MGLKGNRIHLRTEITKGREIGKSKHRALDEVGGFANKVGVPVNWAHGPNWNDVNLEPPNLGWADLIV